MDHAETRRLVPGAKYAALFIHGIVGTPNHFRIVLPLEELVPETWSVYNICQPGHGGSVEDFGKSNINQWRSHAKAAFDELVEKHEKIVIVGHSLGTLFAMQMALEHPEKVAFLFLVAAPMRPWVRLFGAVNCVKLAFGLIREDRPLEWATKHVCGVEPMPLVWKYIPWLPRFFELFAEIARTESVMGGLRVPCVAWQSKKDELVSNSSARVLRKSGVMEIHELEHSSHFYYAPEDLKILQKDFLKYIDYIEKETA